MAASYRLSDKRFVEPRGTGRCIGFPSWRRRTDKSRQTRISPATARRDYPAAELARLGRVREGGATTRGGGILQTELMVGKPQWRRIMKKQKKAAGKKSSRRAAPRHRGRPPSGEIVVSSPPGRAEVLPGYDGPRTARDFPHRLPPRIWNPVEGKRRPRSRGAQAAAADVQIDGRSYTVDQTWSGLRFLFKIGALNVADGETFQNLFTTHIGRTIDTVAHWTEIGVARFIGDGKYYLYTYDSEVAESDRWNFFGHMRRGEVFEFAIRLNENDPGPFAYETFCSGVRVRKGHLPSIECQVDLSHESWSHTGTFSTGDNMIALEGWVNYPPARARWYAPDLPIGFYSTNPAVKHVTLQPPFAYKMDSTT